MRRGGSGWRSWPPSVVTQPAAAPEQAAIDRAIDEIGRIGDPHRAIDWLSTFPQVVLSALGERP